LPTLLFSAVQQSNEANREWPRRTLLRALGSVEGRKIAVLGLTYKPGTNTLRRSDSVELCRWLRERRADVVAFDPAVREQSSELNFLALAASAEEALAGADAVVVATEWPEFKSLTADDAVGLMRAPVVVDAGGFLAETISRDARVRYFTVGRAPKSVGEPAAETVSASKPARAGNRT